MAKHSSKRHPSVSRNPYSRNNPGRYGSNNLSKSKTHAHGPSQRQQEQQKSSPASVQRLTKAQKEQQIPFTENDHILLVGEGDFSYTLSLLEHHGDKLTRLLATTVESSTSLMEKHPSVGSTLESIAQLDAEIAYNVDATALVRSKEVKHAVSQSTKDSNGRRELGLDWIVFNFPHTGGLSTDVNRQVRANQALLVGFFESARELLRKAEPGFDRPEGHSGGKLLVTLFEGEPYTLWNIKDLARHAGYRVVRSYAFPWYRYPGYRHARTLGDLQSKRAQPQQAAKESPAETKSKEDKFKGFSDGDGDEKRPGAWRGEDRPARSYIFEVNYDELKAREDEAKQEQLSRKQAKERQKKRRRQDSSSDEE